MSAPMPAPDKFAARLISLTAFVVMIGMIVKANEVDGGTAKTGFVLIFLTLLWIAVMGAAYRTRVWR